MQDVADSCRTGAATNVIFGLALGYKSVIIPIFAIAVSIFVSFTFAAMYGIAVAALGMLSTIATGLAIDAYGPISDNAGGIAEMAGMSHRIRERTDALDAAGNTTAAIGKVFFGYSFNPNVMPGSILYLHWSWPSVYCLNRISSFPPKPSNELLSKLHSLFAFSRVLPLVQLPLCPLLFSVPLSAVPVSLLLTS